MGSCWLFEGFVLTRMTALHRFVTRRDDDDRHLRTPPSLAVRAGLRPGCLPCARRAGDRPHHHDAGDDWREQAAQKLPMGKLGQPDEIADFVVLLLSDRSGVVTGSVIDWDQNVLGGLD